MLEADEQADDRQGLRLLRHPGRGRHGAAARHRRPAGRAHADGGDGAGAAAPLHALSGLRRGVRQRARRAARAPPLRGAAERRRGEQRPPRPALPRAPRARDEAARPAARPRSGARRATWRSSSTSTARSPVSSRSRTCSRRSSARSTTSSTPRTPRSCASGRIATGSRAACRSRSSTSASSGSSRTRTTTRSAASSSASSGARRQVGDSVEIGHVKFDVATVDGTRILHADATLLPVPEHDEDDDEDGDDS